LCLLFCGNQTQSLVFDEGSVMKERALNKCSCCDSSKGMA
jgi:hypothetical protein